MENHSKKSTLEQSPSTNKRRKLATRIGSTVTAVAAAIGLYAGAAEIGKTEVEGRAVAAESHAPTLSPELLSNAEKYAISSERNERISEKVDEVSERIISDAEKHPERVSYKEVEDGRGELTDTIKVGNTTYIFTLNVAKNGRSYAQERRHKNVSLRSETSLTTAGDIAHETIKFTQEHRPENDAVSPWTTGNGSGTSNAEGMGMGGFEEASPEGAKIGMSTEQIVAIDAAALRISDEFLAQSGI